MALKLIVGIGNPDQEYQETRHNIGFTILEKLAKKIEADDFENDTKSNALFVKGVFEREGKKKVQVLLAEPQTYVNKSGEAVSALAKKNKIKAQDVIIIHDDLDIPFGNVKLSFDKNSGGHRGIESIIKALKTKKFYRIRIGTGVRALDKARQQSDKKRDEFVKDFVLKKFTPSEREEIKNLFKETLKRLEQIL
ncbi:MAG: aminoacyl-tRNA hydrolase [Patescibacteria group bacterium]